MNSRISVIIVTLNRPDCVAECLRHLAMQTRLPDQVIVVDASRDDLTRKVVAGWPAVLYLRNDNGFGKMTVSRNIGLASATGRIVAFVDDDAYAHTDWCRQVVLTFSNDMTIGVVGGRVLPVPPNASAVASDVGRVNRNGVLHGNFWADLPAAIDVDHVMGCNMSYRREVLARAGGFRELLVGISGVAEDSDMCLRARNLGNRVVFTPFAIVDHLGAPQSKGRRFDYRYAYAAGRNYTMMLVHNYGLRSAKPWRYVFVQGLYEIARGVRRPHHAHRVSAYLLGTLIGLVRGTWLAFTTGRSPIRDDDAARTLRATLSV